MAILPAEVKEQLRLSVPLIDLVAEIVPRDRMRPDAKGARMPCPFEEGSTNASKFLVTDDNRFHCFGCGEKGDIFNWLMSFHGLNFPQALEYLAERSGFDLKPYQRPPTPEERARQQVESALGLVADLARTTALARPESERQIGGMDITQLIESGEIGLLPEAAATAAMLDEAGVPREVRRVAGLEAAGAQFGRRWVFWARRGTAVVAGRLFGRGGPIVGVYGARSTGWTSPPRGTSVQGGTNRPLVTLDDRHYLALRLAGCSNVHRPVSIETMQGQWRQIPKFAETRTPPTVLLTAEQEGRPEVFEALVGLVGANPRLLTRGWDGAVPPGEHGAEISERVAEPAGTVLDWQIGRLAAVGGFANARRREQARERLDRIVAAAAAHPLEAAVYGALVDEVLPRRRERRAPTQP